MEETENNKTRDQLLNEMRSAMEALNFDPKTIEYLMRDDQIAHYSDGELQEEIDRYGKMMENKKNVDQKVASIPNRVDEIAAQVEKDYKTNTDAAISRIFEKAKRRIQAEEQGGKPAVEAEPQKRVDWAKLVNDEKFFDPERKKRYVEKVQKKDVYIPEAVKTMQPTDVPEIEKAVKAIHAEVVGGIPSYSYFIKLLKKIQVLVVENAPDFFATLPPELQSRIRNAKIDFPTEQEVNREIFTAMDKPTGALKGGFTFDMLIRDVLKNSELSKKLSAAYDQYKAEFAKQSAAA